MKYYRYFGYQKPGDDFIFKSLNDKLFRASRVSSFNDPFDFFPYVEPLRGQSLESYITQLVEQNGQLNGDVVRRNLSTFEYDRNLADEFVDENLRVICFSAAEKLTPQADILMWSHYASKHHGVRVTFEIPEPADDRMRQMFQVLYSDDRVKIELEKVFQFPLPPEQGQILWRTAVTKSSAWEYEKEYRLIHKLDDCIKIEGHEYLEFPPSCIKEITFGLRFPQEEIERYLLLRNGEYSHVRFFRMKSSAAAYALEAVELK